MATTLEEIESVATEIVDLAHLRGINLSTHGGVVLSDERLIFLWHKDSAVHYNLQGRVALLPDQFRDSACEFHGFYNEAGTILNLEQAVDLVIAWIVDRREVHDFPLRKVRSCGIG